MSLIEILKRPEGKTLEFKRDLSSPDGALQVSVALLNTSGGTPLVGVEDRSYQVLGAPDALDLEKRLADLVIDRIIPFIVPELNSGAKRLHVVIVSRIIQLRHVKPERSRLFLKMAAERAICVRRSPRSRMYWATWNNG